MTSQVYLSSASRVQFGPSSWRKESHHLVVVSSGVHSATPASIDHPLLLCSVNQVGRVRHTAHSQSFVADPIGLFDPSLSRTRSSTRFLIREQIREPTTVDQVRYNMVEKERDRRPCEFLAFVYRRPMGKRWSVIITKPLMVGVLTFRLLAFPAVSSFTSLGFFVQCQREGVKN